MNLMLTLGLLIASLWVALRYHNPGALGMGGAGIAALSVLDNQTAWTWTTLALSGGLFLIGMVCPKTVDDIFHGLALLVNALQWGWLAIASIFGWSGWRDMSTAPTVLVFAGAVAILYVLYRMARYLANRFSPASTN